MPQAAHVFLGQLAAGAGGGDACAEQKGLEKAATGAVKGVAQR